MDHDPFAKNPAHGAIGEHFFEKGDLFKNGFVPEKQRFEP